MKKILVFFDGSCAPTNPGGDVGIGVIIYEAEGVNVENPSTRQSKITFSSCKRIHEISRKFRKNDPIFIPDGTTNNVAEHLALYNGLWWAMAKFFQHPDIYDKILCFGDSEIAIKHMDGRYPINTDKPYGKFAMRSRQVLSVFDKHTVEFFWIPREVNHKADVLSRECNEYCYL